MNEALKNNEKDNPEGLKELRQKIQKMIRDFTKKVQGTADEYGVKLDVVVHVQQKPD